MAVPGKEVVTTEYREEVGVPETVRWYSNLKQGGSCYPNPPLPGTLTPLEVVGEMKVSSCGILESCKIRPGGEYLGGGGREYLGGGGSTWEGVGVPGRGGGVSTWEGGVSTWEGGVSTWEAEATDLFSEETPELRWHDDVMFSKNILNSSKEIDPLWSRSMTSNIASTSPKPLMSSSRSKCAKSGPMAARNSLGSILLSL